MHDTDEDPPRPAGYRPRHRAYCPDPELHRTLDLAAAQERRFPPASEGCRWCGAELPEAPAERPPSVRRETVGTVYWAGVSDGSCGVHLLWDKADPFAVTAVFLGGGEEVPWVFARDLLAAADSRGGLGDVQVWRTRSLWLWLRLTSPDGVMDARLPLVDVDDFLAATAKVVPFGAERIDVDGLIGQLMDGAR